MVQFLLRAGVIVVQTFLGLQICPGAGFKLRADARVRIYQRIKSRIISSIKSKKCDKQLTHIVRVMFRPNFKTVRM